MAQILISNKMTSQYNLIGNRNSSRRFKVVVGNYEDNYSRFTIRVRALKRSSNKFTMYVKYKRDSYRGFRLQPTINNIKGFTIEVNPHNKMTARYVLKEPPIIEYEDLPIQDAYTLSQNPYSSINYGNANSIIVGNSNRGVGEGFVQFDLKGLDQDVRIKSAKLRLYYDNLNTSQLELYRVSDSWRELNITDLNKPPRAELLTSDYIINNEKRYIEFDITDITSRWLKGFPNNGVSIISPDGTNTIFRSRESGMSPQLVVQYFSNNPLNTAVKRNRFKLTIQRHETKSRKFTMNVHTTFKNSYRGFSILSHNRNHIFSNSRRFNLIVSRKESKFTLFVKQTDSSSRGFRISVANYGISQRGFTIDALRETKELNSNRSFRIIVAKKESSSRGFTIVSNRITQHKLDIRKFTLNVNGKYKTTSNLKGFTIESYKEYIESSSKAQFNITIPTINSSRRGFTLNVNRKISRFRITVPYIKDSITPFTVRARILSANNRSFKIIVGNNGTAGHSRIYII